MSAYSYVQLPGDGSISLFTFSFPYLDRSHIHVKVDGVDVIFAWLSSSSISITPAPTGIVEIRRITPKDQPPVNFSDGSVLKESELDLLATFSLYCAQESSDSNDQALDQSALGAAFYLVYQGSRATAPTVRADGSALHPGDLYYDTVKVSMQVYTGTAWKNAGSAVEGGLKRPAAPFIATGGETFLLIPDGYDPGEGLVFINGSSVHYPEADITNGISIIFTPALTSGDEVDYLFFGAIEGPTAPPVAGVTSFNGRDGVVTLNNNDVIAAIGGVPVKLTDLNTSGGAGNIGYQRSGSGSVLRSLNAVVNLVDVTPEDFGATGNGTTNDSIAFQNALNSLPPGGRLKITGRYLLDSQINVPSNVTIVGSFGMVGTDLNNATAPYGSLKSALVLNSAGGLVLGGGAGIVGCLIHRKGQTFPAATTAGYAGTAISSVGDDSFVHNCMILGFNKAYFSDGHQRPDIRECNIDCHNGLDIQQCYDIGYIDRVHCWPFVTVGGGGGNPALHRTGIAFNFANGGDWNKVTNCFAYGYFRGYVANGVNSMTFQNCGADGTQVYDGQIGFQTMGTTGDVRFLGCQAAGQEFGYYLQSSSAYKFTEMTSCDGWNCRGATVVAAGEDVRISGGHFHTTPYGVTVTSATARVTISEVRFGLNISILPIEKNVTNPNVHIWHNDYTTFASAVYPDTDVPSGGGGATTAASVSFVPHGAVTATDVQAAINSVIDSSGATPAASAVSFTPYGVLTATNVQAALQQVPANFAYVTGNNTNPFQTSTATVDSNSTVAATTAWYMGQGSSATPIGIGSSAVGTSLRWARADHVHAATAANVTSTAPSGITSTTVQGAINELAARSAPSASTTTPAAIGSASVGTGTTYARADHVHAASASAVSCSSSIYTSATDLNTFVGQVNNTFAYVNGNATNAFQSNAFTGKAVLTSSGTTSALSVTGSTTAYAASVDGKISTVAKSSNLGLWLTNTVIPVTDNTYNSGDTSFRWGGIVSATAVVVSSDARYKKEVLNSDLGLDFVNGLRPVSYVMTQGRREVIQDAVYEWVDTEDRDGDGNFIKKQVMASEPVLRDVSGFRRHYGFIAQEVKEQLGERDAGIWCLADPADTESLQSLRYEELIAPLVKAIQELSARVVALEAQLAA